MIAQLAPNLTTSETNRLVAEPTRLARPKSPRAAAKEIPEPQERQNAPPTAVARRDTRAMELPLAASPTPLDRRQPVSVAEAIAVTPETRQLADVTRTESKTQNAQEPVAARVSKQVASRLPNEQVADEPTNEVRAATPTKTPRRQSAMMAADSPVPSQQPRNVIEAALSSADATPEPLVAAVPRAATRQQSSSPAPRVLADSRGGRALEAMASTHSTMHQRRPRTRLHLLPPRPSGRGARKPSAGRPLRLKLLLPRRSREPRH